MTRVDQQVAVDALRIKLQAALFDITPHACVIVAACDDRQFARRLANLCHHYAIALDGLDRLTREEYVPDDRRAPARQRVRL